MILHGDVPAGYAEPLGGMLDAYDGYRQFVGEHQGNSNLARAQRAAALSLLQQYMTDLVHAYPNVGDLYAGIWRVLNNHLENLDQGA